MRSGYFSIDGGKLLGHGESGYNWSSQSLSEDVHAYNLGFNNRFVYQSNYSSRWAAFPLRCLAN